MSAPVVETVRVGAVVLHYVEGDTETPRPPPIPGWRRCRGCARDYPVTTGKTCDCWGRDYAAQVRR